MTEVRHTNRFKSVCLSAWVKVACVQQTFLLLKSHTERDLKRALTVQIITIDAANANFGLFWCQQATIGGDDDDDHV